MFLYSSVFGKKTIGSVPILLGDLSRPRVGFCPFPGGE